MRKSRISFVLACFAIARPGFGEGVKEILSALPGDVTAVALVGNLKQADAEFRSTIERMGLGDVIPPEHREPLARLKEKLPGLSGFDENGSLALVILKSSSLPELMSRVAVLLPASAPAKLLDDLGGDPARAGDEEIKAVLLFGQTMYATATARHVAVSKTAEVARQIRQQQKALRDVVPAHELDSLDDLDVAVWLDAGALLAIFKPQIDGLVSWGLMMQMGAGDVGEEEARAAKKQVDTVAQGMSSLLMGVKLSDQGVGLHFIASSKPGSDLARQTQHAAPRAPLLEGLPRRNYLAAFGQEFHPASLRAAVENSLKPILADLRSDSATDKAKIDEVQKNVTEAIEMLRAARGTIDHINAGSVGMVAASMVLETTDSNAWVQLATKSVQQLNAIHAKSNGEEGTETESLVKLTADAETLEGVSVSHATFDLIALENFDADEIALLKTIFGTEGVQMRFGAADAKNVAVTVCGGSEHMARLIRSIRRKESALHQETGIALAARGLRNHNDGAFFLAIDRMVHFFQGVLDEVDESAYMPFWMPRVDAPLAIGLGGGDGWSRSDIFIPMPLLSSIAESVRDMESYDQEDEDLLDEAEEEPVEQDADSEQDETETPDEHGD